MDTLALMTEIGVRLATIPTLRVVPVGMDGPVQPPAAVIYLPERIDYDLSYGRGTVKISDLQVVILVANTTRRTAPAVLAPFMSDTGAKSIKKCLDTTAASGYTNAFDVQVIYSEIDYAAKMSDADYIAGIFHLNAYGPGA